MSPITIALIISTSLIANFSIVSSSLADKTSANQTIDATDTILVADNNAEQNLNNNKCLKTLGDNDKIVVSAAFHEGAGGFRQLRELLDREPWGYVADPVMQQELDTLVKQQSPFLIVTMTKKQALLLESHRDLIKWILVQSTEKACA